MKLPPKLKLLNHRLSKRVKEESSHHYTNDVMFTKVKRISFISQNALCVTLNLSFGHHSGTKTEGWGVGKEMEQRQQPSRSHLVNNMDKTFCTALVYFWGTVNVCQKISGRDLPMINNRRALQSK